MKRLMSILAAVILFSGGLAVTAYAAKKDAPPPGPNEAQLKKGKTDAPAIVTASGVVCTIKNAAYLGTGTQEVDRKKVKIDNYEVACSEGQGIIFSKLETGTVTHYSCAALATAYETNKKAAHCTLPENLDINAQVQPLVSRSGATCTVNNVLFRGVSASDQSEHYEIGCSEGPGFLLDTDPKGAPLPPVPCTEAAPYVCKYTPKTAQLAQIGALAAAADKSCQMSDFRFVGRAQDSDHVFYEVACTGKPGFFVETSKGALVKSLDCIHAEGLGGGCTLTDVSAVKAGAAQSYAQVLASNGVKCTPTDSKVQGNDARTNRDAVEFKCAEQPTGLVAMIPAGTSKGKFQAMDCFEAKALFAVDCTLTPKPALLGHLKAVLTAVEKVCEPSDYAIVAPDDNGDGYLIEVKCGGGQSGYVVDLPPDRSKTIKTLSCEQEARNGNPCQIAGNK